MMVVSSKNDGCGSKSRARKRLMKSTTSASEIISPLTRMRSRKSMRWGEVYSATRMPADWSTAAMVEAVEPLPLVPATWMQRKRLCGSPKAWLRRRTVSSPGL